MFVFLVALKSPAACHDWLKASSLLRKTLDSIQNQSNSSFRTIVVCNQQPILESINIDWVLTDIRSPNLLASFREKEKDRAQKLQIGFDYAKRFDPSYLMPIDADDFVSNNIVEYVLANPPVTEGYYLEAGFINEQKGNLIFIDKGFKEYCGSSLIVKSSAFPNYLQSNTYMHNSVENLTKLPFAGAIYNRLNGENFAATEPLKQAMGVSDPKFVNMTVTSDIVNTFKFI